MQLYPKPGCKVLSQRSDHHINVSWSMQPTKRAGCGKEAMVEIYRARASLWKKKVSKSNSLYMKTIEYILKIDNIIN